MWALSYKGEFLRQLTSLTLCGWKKLGGFEPLTEVINAAGFGPVLRQVRLCLALQLCWFRRVLKQKWPTTRTPAYRHTSLDGISRSICYATCFS